MSKSKYISTEGVVAAELVENLEYAAKHNQRSRRYSTRKQGREYALYADFIKEQLGDQLNVMVDAEKMWQDFKALTESVNEAFQYYFKF